MQVVSVCRTWRLVLDSECMWERKCRMQWPGAKPLRGYTWHDFATLGGGQHLGQQLLRMLKTVSAKHAACPAGHSLHRRVVDILGWHCDMCGKEDLPLGTVIWGCRDCNYDKCQPCYQVAEIAPRMLAAGAHNCRDQDGWTALHHSCRLGFHNVARRLLEAQANVESMDHVHGYTALMVSAIHGNPAVCALLLESGAAKDTRNRHSRNALDCARVWGHTELEPLLQ